MLLRIKVRLRIHPSAVCTPLITISSTDMMRAALKNSLPSPLPGRSFRRSRLPGHRQHSPSLSCRILWSVVDYFYFRHFVRSDFLHVFELFEDSLEHLTTPDVRPTLSEHTVMSRPLRILHSSHDGQHW